MSDRDRDLACMGRLRAGDASALEELYDRHGGLLYSVVLKIVGRATDAEDVLQEAWFQVWKRCGSYDPSRGPVVAWLVTLAKSRAIDRYRSLAARQRAEDSVAVAEPPAAPADPPATAVHRQLHEHVTKGARIAHRRTAASARAGVFRRAVAERGRGQDRRAARHGEVMDATGAAQAA
jgi:RNA polymerase sigma factor (sigma-70 family)